MKWFKKELYIPPVTIDKQNRDKWESSGKTNIFDRAQAEVRRILESHKPKPLGKEREELLNKAFRKIMEAKQIGNIPFGPDF